MAVRPSELIFVFLFLYVRINNVIILVESMIRGYHIYRDIWDAVVREEFPCKRKDGNRVNPFSVAIVRCNTTIG